MLMVFAGLIALCIGLVGVTERFEPKELPKGELRVSRSEAGAGPGSDPVNVVPMSEFKFRHIERQQYDYSCGSAALVTIIRHHLGLDISEQQAMEGMLAKGQRERIIAQRSFSLLDMKLFLASIEVRSGGFRTTVEELAKLSDPAIVPIDYGGFKHFVVLRGLRDGRAFLADPSAGHLVLSVEEFAKIWDRNTLFVVYPKDGMPPVARLALGEEELGVMDYERIREGIAPDRAMNLQRAIDNTAGGIYTLRR